MAILEQPERSIVFQPGQTFGKFYLVQLIGEGGTSLIFKALQQPISRLVALKIPSFARSGNILTPDEFLSEATLMAKLEHGNIVRIYDFGVFEEKAFICMEYVDGWNLAELGGTRLPLSHASVLSIAWQTLEALVFSHAHDVLHQDLSPANVMVSKQGAVKLSDFGMAGKKPLPGHGKVVGTPAFLSPEHLRGKPCTAASDLFSFGSLVYFLGRGEPLFDPGDGYGRINQAFGEIGEARAHPPLERIGRLPASLARVVRMAIQGDEPEAMLRELKEQWGQSEGTARPDAALRRELSLMGEALPGWIAADAPIPTGEDLRNLYLRLRGSGRHREAVALLEQALRREPDNPMLRELLATPAAGSMPGSGTMEIREAPSPGRKAAKYAALAAALGIAAVTWAVLSGTRPLPGSAPENPASQAIPAGAGAAVAAAAAFPPPQPSRPRRPSAANRIKKAVPALSATLSLAGPAGTQVIINDTLRRVSPSPAEGWALTPGLVNLALSHPGLKRPISSSLFVSADTHYVLLLDEDGGFSVSRKPK